MVLTGAGDKAFCAGADLTGIAENAGAAAAHDGRGLLANLFRDMWSLGKPIIARVRGYALAGGFGLACACDMIVASDDSVFGTPEINVGLWPYMITVPLLRSMPPKTALDLMITGRRVPAEEGARLGFVQRVVPAADLDATVDALAAELAAKSPLIMRWGRDSFYRVLEMDADAALSYLQGMLTVTTQTEDAAEGVAAFAEKRAPTVERPMTQAQIRRPGCCPGRRGRWRAGGRSRMSTEFTMPETQYAQSGDLSIAYQVLGDGPIDVVFVSGFISHQELQWEGAMRLPIRRVASTPG